MSDLVCGVVFAVSIAISALFVGMMPSSVQGQFAIIKTAPTKKPSSLVYHQAISPNTQPTTASGACIARPRL